MKTSPTLEDGSENSLSIPIDLIIEIFLRFPVNSIARCRCVSKLWASILSRPDFTELFLTQSWARPKLLFAYIKGCEVLFFSSPQNPDENSSPLIANYHTNFSVDDSYEIDTPVNGLICLRQERIINQEYDTVLVICNPSTGQSLPLPKSKNGSCWASSFCGYDPIDKQFKVLASTHVKNSDFYEHHVLTLGTGNMSWRTIQLCCIPHFCFDGGICIDGLLYYYAGVNINNDDDHVLVCFDVRSEEFRFIIADACPGSLINYNGKLGKYGLSTFSCGCFRGRSSIELWVLEDAEKQKWSKHSYYVLPAMLHDIMVTTNLRCVGMTQTKEFVFQSEEGRPFYVFYCNIERNTIKKVEMQGMEALKDSKIYTFIDHAEDVKLMQIF